MPKKSQHEAAQFIAVALGAFKKAGFRITNPRRAVVQALAGSAKPMSVAEILSLVKKKHGPESVDKVSIYRTVEKLIDLSLVHRVGPAGEIFRCAHTACRSGATGSRADAAAQARRATGATDVWFVFTAACAT